MLSPRSLRVGLPSLECSFVTSLALCLSVAVLRQHHGTTIYIKMTRITLYFLAGMAGTPELHCFATGLDSSNNADVGVSVRGLRG